MNVEHGTVLAYVRAKCRCPACRAAKAAYRIRWLEQKVPVRITKVPRPKKWVCQECGFLCVLPVQRCDHVPWWEDWETKLEAACRALPVEPEPRPTAFKPKRFEEIEHGTYTCYNYWKCRCDVCRTAATERRRRLKAKVA